MSDVNSLAQELANSHLGYNLSLNFWSVGGYKNVVKRMEHGAKEVEALGQIYASRIKLEKNYAAELKAWCASNEKQLTKQPQFGSLQAAYMTFFQAADELAQRHLEIAEEAQAVLNELNSFHSSNYHKEKFSSSYKEVNSAVKNFSRVQKRWDSLQTEVTANKRAVGVKAKDHQKAVLDYKMAEADPKKADKLSKLKDTMAKAASDEERAISKYEGSVSLMQTDSPRYQTEMTNEFEATQAIERLRLGAVQQSLASMSHALNIFEKPHLDEILTNAANIAHQIDINGDLDEFATMFATGNDFSLPEDAIVSFETLRSSPTLSSSNSISSNHIRNDSRTSLSGNKSTSAIPTRPVPPSPQQSSINSLPPVYMRSLYSFVAQSDEELSMNISETFKVIAPEDENGWILAENNNKTKGYIPANYVEFC